MNEGYFFIFILSLQFFKIISLLFYFLFFDEFIKIKSEYFRSFTIGGTLI